MHTWTESLSADQVRRLLTRVRSPVGIVGWREERGHYRVTLGYTSNHEPRETLQAEIDRTVPHRVKATFCNARNKS